MSAHNLYFEQKYEKYQNFLSKNFHFLVVKVSVYLNMRVFVMTSNSKKGSTPKKVLAPTGSKFFPFKVVSFWKGGENLFDGIVSSESVSVALKQKVSV